MKNTTLSMKKEQVLEKFLKRAYEAARKEYEETKSKNALNLLHDLGRFIEELDTDEDYQYVTAFYYEEY